MSWTSCEVFPYQEVLKTNLNSDGKGESLGKVKVHFTGNVAKRRKKQEVTLVLFWLSMNEECLQWFREKWFLILVDVLASFYFRFWEPFKWDRFLKDNESILCRHYHSMKVFFQRSVLSDLMASSVMPDWRTFLGGETKLFWELFICGSGHCLCVVFFWEMLQKPTCLWVKLLW